MIEDSEDFMTRNLKILKEQMKYRNPFIFTAEEVRIEKVSLVAKSILKALSDGEMVEVKKFVDEFVTNNNVDLDIVLNALDLLIEQDKIIHVEKVEMKYIAIRDTSIQ